MVRVNQTSSGKEAFHRLLLLMGARIFGIVFSFAIPMYLGRHLDVEIYGTYKQILFIFWLSQIALNFGFDDSVYYFLKIDRKNFSLYGFNALIFNLVTTGLIAVAMFLFKDQIGITLNNPHISQYIPLLGIVLILTVSSLQIEGYLLNLERFKARLFLDSGTEILKSVSILVAFIVYNSIHMVLIFLALIMLARMIWAIRIIHEHKLQDNVNYLDSKKLFFKQARFAIPLGISRIIQNILNLETLLISSFFNLIQYTFYSVGCFDNPIINSMRTSLYELVNIELVENIRENNFAKAADTWRRLTRKLYLVAIPFTVFMMFFSKEVIVFIFSEKYLDSVPFFIVYNLYILISALNPEPLFRATSQTGFALKIRIVGVFIGIGAIIGGAYYFGPMAVLWAKMAAVAFINLTGLYIGSKLIHTKIYKMFLWKELGQIALFSILISGFLRLAVNSSESLLAMHPFWILAICFSIYFFSLFLLSWKTVLLKKDETDHIFYLLKKILIKFSIIRRS